MRQEKDFIGTVSLPENALYGIHSFRAKQNFPSGEPFPLEWYKAAGKVKAACYATIQKFKEAVVQNYPVLLSRIKLPDDEILKAMLSAADEISSGKHYDNFIVPAIQGGAGTSINMNINEIITNLTLLETGHQPGEYQFVDPIEDANLFQSTNDVIPTALTVSIMELLNILEDRINQTRRSLEQLEIKYRNALRISYTQMQEAVPSTFGQLFSTYNEALSRDWWRVSKASERIKVINLGGGATGTGISLPRYYIMEVVPQLRKLTGFPLTQGENLPDATSNMDRFVEVHAILKAHAVNLEKIAGDLRLLSSGIKDTKELEIPSKQVGSSIMPGKVNPVICEFLISGAHTVYANDLQISSLAGQGCLELNAYLPGIGIALLQSLKLMIAMNDSLKSNILEGLQVNVEDAEKKLFRSPAITTVLAPLIGYNKASEIARYMKKSGKDIFEANQDLKIFKQKEIERMMMPENLLKKGFSIKDISDYTNQDQ